MSYQIYNHTQCNSLNHSLMNERLLNASEFLRWNIIRKNESQSLKQD